MAEAGRGAKVISAESIQRLPIATDTESQGKDEEERQGTEVGQDFEGTVSLEQDSADDAEKVGEGKEAANILGPAGHAAERENTPPGRLVMRRAWDSTSDGGDWKLGPEAELDVRLELGMAAFDLLPGVPRRGGRVEAGAQRALDPGFPPTESRSTRSRSGPRRHRCGARIRAFGESPTWRIPEFLD